MRPLLGPTGADLEGERPGDHTDGESPMPFEIRITGAAPVPVPPPLPGVMKSCPGALHRLLDLVGDVVGGLATEESLPARGPS